MTTMEVLAQFETMQAELRRTLILCDYAQAVRRRARKRA